ncbi:MAG: protein kinase [Planctomycetes bacterium]|nr:protein kinase [Planctomycetota bacterium]
MTAVPPPNDPPSDAGAPLHPTTASVLAALSRRGVTLPGASRPAAGTDVDAPRYTVLDQLARGGMGVVMRVRDEDLRRELAMKVLDRAGRTGDPTASDPRDLGRFLEEAQVTGQLDHPGVPPIHELGLDKDGRLFFTMKLVRGGTFADVIAHVHAGTEHWTLTRALGVVLKVCEAMAYAHHKGVVHRDLKPANVMVGRFGETYVMDWGLAKVLVERSEPGAAIDDSMFVSRSIVHTDRREAADDIDSSHVTLDGDVIGTPAYMAPEQARGDLASVGAHSDVYAVGAMLYHLVAGRSPYLEPGVRVSPHSVLRWVLDGPPKPLAQLAPDAPPELVAVIEKAMAREPSARYASMLALSEDLQAFIEDRVVRAYQSGAWAEFKKWTRRNKALAAAFGVVLLVTLGALAAVGWVQASGRKAVEEKNAQLAETNGALEDSNTRLAETNDALADSLTQLGAANDALAESNDALEDKNTELADANAALDVSRAAAEQARAAAEMNAKEAADNAARAARNEHLVVVESYAAHMTAAAAALEQGAQAAARRHLEACPEDLRRWDWRHLALRVDGSLATFTGPASLLNDVVYSPDGRQLATVSGPFFTFGADESEVRIWDASSGATKTVLPVEDTTPICVTFSPDGALLAFGDSDGYVSVWDVARERMRPTRHWMGASVRQLVFADTDRLVVLAFEIGGDFGRAAVWNTRTLEVEFTHEAQPAPSAVAVSRDGSRFAIGYVDHSLEVRDRSSGAMLLGLPPRKGLVSQVLLGPGAPGIQGLAFDPDGRRLAVTGSDRVVRLLDAHDGHELATRALSGAVPLAVGFHPDGPWLVITDSSGSLRFLDSETLVEIERLPAHDIAVSGLAVRPDGDEIATTGWDGTLRLWDGRPGSASQVLANRAASTETGGPNERAQKLAFSPDGRFVAWAPGPRAALVADAITGDVLFRLSEADSAIGGLTFTPDGRRILVQTEIEGLQAFDATDGRLLSAVPAIDYTRWVVFDPTCTLMAKSIRGNRVELYLVATGELAATLSGHAGNIGSAAFTPDSQRLVTASEDGALRVWDLRTGRAEKVIETGDKPFALQLADGGRRALVTSLDPTRNGVTEWDLETGELVAWHPSSHTSFDGALHPDGTRWASADLDGSVSIWDRERGAMFSLPAGEHAVMVTAFDPTGTRLAAVDKSGRLFLWDTLAPAARRAARGPSSSRLHRTGEARALVDALFDEHLLASRVLAALAGDTSLDADLREAAVRDVRVRGDSAPWVIERLWPRLFAADASSIAEWQPLAEEVMARWPSYMETLEPLIYVTILGGDLERARSLLTEVVDVGYTFQPQGPKAAFALDALEHAYAGDAAEGRRLLREARADLDRARQVTPGELSDLAVTERLIGMAAARLDGE